ncbi:putative nuclease HARBI1 [Cajanus cajan]|uniref:putative nuclease HARBI1 n=1 Tax=Cajanus cajan TaxID=3821 RepID=UPI00098DA23B|nr:putative nuclease HARBI1 [Cajanus cajan]XP_020221933.1 putative nuclease HARBI1 [Cajanus cajan]XP_020221934.1 putative nuclease HARBI1 [Cajanus cajan]XP_020221936.1 putative nuclease HARBI1 [Cajanus cajan]XP_020221937.1 putative nuclease HARBI1 [Cajanus cajan]XP_020221938.1 putative nuclease HARBI1 [Cajanus cajan]
MESSEEENEGVSGNHVPKELRPLASDGVKFIDEVLDGQNERCLEKFRMDKHVFYKLCDILQAKGLLRHTNRVKIEEQLAIFMFIIGHNLRTRAVQELFHLSGETISRHFNNVLNAIMSISLDFFQPPGPGVPSEIFEDSRFYPYFKDCVGAIDGIHVPVTVGVDEQGPFRNKNGLLSQNILAACSFDLKFHYVLAGWEGSATDLQIFNSAITRGNKLHVPEGKYYIVDSKYPNVPGFVAPYSSTPYYSKEFPNDYHPQNATELFNQRHSLLRNVTDRTFGALKARFPILMSAPSYPLQTQVKLVVAACVLHNYIRREKPDDWIFKMYENASFPMEESQPPLEMEVPPKMNVETQTQSSDHTFDAEEIAFASQLRDSITTEMWNDFINDFGRM